MRTFRQKLNEINTSHQDLAIDKNINPGVFSNPDVLKKINAWVGQIAGSYVLPEQAVHQLRSSLLKIGLTFGEAIMEGKSGSIELPLTLYGGRFGKDTDTPYDEFVNDDGISHKKDGGLKLEFKWEKQSNNTYKVFANLI